MTDYRLGIVLGWRSVDVFGRTRKRAVISKRRHR